MCIFFFTLILLKATSAAYAIRSLPLRPPLQPFSELLITVIKSFYPGNFISLLNALDPTEMNWTCSIGSVVIFSLSTFEIWLQLRQANMCVCVSVYVKAAIKVTYIWIRVANC